ncbi:MAG: aminotransferase class V-fold PLP-dependent enzyme, partial [Phycisphaerales bacterium]|nr:aminotransferase class V-fold PLP-dependent enzyme [Phycisphaerales bacterium]
MSMTSAASAGAVGTASGAVRAMGAAVFRTAGGRVFNFNAGPSILPEEVIRQIQADIWDAGGTGFGIMEHSHRAKYYDDVLKETEAVVREVGSVPSNYRVLFMTGGSTSQNLFVPTNFLPAGRTADYIVTGYWGQRSFDDGVQFANY